MDYGFTEAKNTMVISTKKVIGKENAILLVSHDEDDGMWEFLDGYDVKEEEAVIVSLLEIVHLDSTVNQIADLPLGWIAYRDNIQEEWKHQPNGWQGLSPEGYGSHRR